LPRILAAVASLIAVPLAAPPAHADGAGGLGGSVVAPPVVNSSLLDLASAEAPPPPMDRSWLYADDARTPGVMRSIAFSRTTFTASDAAARPFASDLAHPGAVLEAGAEVGLARGLSLQAVGLNDSLGLIASPQSGMMTGLRFAPFGEGPTRLVASGGYMNELGGAHGAWGRLSVARDVGRARFATSVYGEHVFSPTRDSLDVMVTAGVNYQVAGPVRLGAEYVAQDIEEAFDDGSEGGIRHFVGPTVGLDLLHHSLAITAGPAAGLSYGSPTALGRAAVAMSF